MSALLEHRGVVQRVADGKAVIAMETSGCSSCGHGGSCGVGKMAAGRPATLLTLPTSEELRPGDVVAIVLPQSRLTTSALLGYLFPALAMLIGAGLGTSFDGSDGGTAIGAMLGFLIAIVVARLVIGLLPGLMPAPQLLARPQPARISPKEFHHEH
ncbi:SoxR reducing system RseC family protein [Azonexus sp.]|uniref:SoxR reducing system RseC family protein n=1 Tax=Azonexus sp. TaxID=1872668 RepID=UPI0035B38223